MVRPVFSMTSAKGWYTGCWMITLSPGWVNMDRIIRMQGTTPGAKAIFSRSGFQPLRASCHPATASKYLGVRQV